MLSLLATRLLKIASIFTSQYRRKGFIDFPDIVRMDFFFLREKNQYYRYVIF